MLCYFWGNNEIRIFGITKYSDFSFLKNRKDSKQMSKAFSSNQT